MTDNVFEFPKKQEELQVEVDLDAFEDEVQDVSAMLTCLLNGLFVSAEMEWDAAMHACFVTAMHCAIQAGYTADEFNQIAQSVSALEE